MAGQFVEIRDYTIEPQWWDAYKKWLIDDGAPPASSGSSTSSISGSRETWRPKFLAPIPSPPLTASLKVCWVIRWENKAARDAGFAALMEDERMAGGMGKAPEPQCLPPMMNGRFMASRLAGKRSFSRAVRSSLKLSKRALRTVRDISRAWL